MNIDEDMLTSLTFLLAENDMFQDDLSEENSYLREYTGRNMYGTECFGIVVKRELVRQASVITYCLAFVLMGNDPERAKDHDTSAQGILEVMRELDVHRTTDDMGKHLSIMYWPNHVRFDKES